MIPPCTHSTHSPRLDLSILPRDILLWTAQPHLHPFHQALQFVFLSQKPFQFPQPGAVPKFPTKIPPDYPSRGPFKLSNQDYVQIPQSGSYQKFLTNRPSRLPGQSPSQTYGLYILPHHPVRVHYEIAQKTPMF